MKAPDLTSAGESTDSYIRYTREEELVLLMAVRLGVTDASATFRRGLRREDKHRFSWFGCENLTRLTI